MLGVTQLWDPAGHAPSTMPQFPKGDASFGDCTGAGGLGVPCPALFSTPVHPQEDCTGQQGQEALPSGERPSTACLGSDSLASLAQGPGSRSPSHSLQPGHPSPSCCPHVEADGALGLPVSGTLVAALVPTSQAASGLAPGGLT